MAYGDYGAIAFKNGKLISTDTFTPMIDTVGWEDTEETLCHHWSDCSNEKHSLGLSGYYFVYVGDEDCTLAFMKDWMVIAERDSYDGIYLRRTVGFGSIEYTWSKWEYITFNELSLIKVTKRNGYYVCKWKYKGDKYKVYFGYGVDLPYYKKWRMVNYYRSPKSLVCQAKRWIKDKIDDFKWSHGWE